MGHRHTILVVDDQADSGDALGLALEEHGFRVQVAHDGQEALDALEHGLRPCLVIVDLMMPRMDGWEFRQRQLSNPQLADLPVLVMTGYPNASKAVATLGVREVLQKPLSGNLLLALVNHHCPRKTADSDADA